MDIRKNALEDWLSALFPSTPYTFSLLAFDASFRRYFRLSVKNKTYVIMDAPPDKEPLTKYLDITARLQQAHLPAPKIFEQNKADGFLLLEDLGDHQLLSCIKSPSINALYLEAINLSCRFSEVSIDNLPAFDADYRLNEMMLFITWYLNKRHELTLSSDEEDMIHSTFCWINKAIDDMPTMFIHRDYHSRNLMVQMPKENIGIIDFQDAMIGPYTYDLVSLLKDCYVTWPTEQNYQWYQYAHKHHSMAQNKSLDDYIKDIHLTGIQRHLKVLGIFSRLYFRDNKPRYLDDIPLTLAYLKDGLSHFDEGKPLLDWLNKRITS